MKTVTEAIFNKFPQCKFGSVFQKYAEILATFELVESTLNVNAHTDGGQYRGAVKTHLDHILLSKVDR